MDFFEVLCTERGVRKFTNHPATKDRANRRVRSASRHSAGISLSSAMQRCLMQTDTAAPSEHLELQSGDATAASLSGGEMQAV